MSRLSWLLLFLRESQFAEDPGEIRAGGLYLHLFIDFHHDTVLIDVVGPAVGKSHLVQGTECGGQFFIGVGQDRKTGVMLLGERDIFFQGINTGHEIGYVEILYLFGAVTQRFALDGSTGRTSHREEGNHNRLLAFIL